jgi:ribA/ribD-fused uncharacterized protein
MKKTYYINQDREVTTLSNFSRHVVKLRDFNWPTSEHYFQAAKFFNTDMAWADEISIAAWPSQAKELGKNRGHMIDEMWDKGLSVKIMLEVLFAKVHQHEVVYNQLMATGDAEIVERADWDNIWGDGPGRDGKNLLGKLWMIVRDTLRENK